MPRQDSGLRRNGRQQACEPCRKGKLRCDHTTPFCERCTRRGITARCVYHPAPMTKPKSSEIPSPETTPVDISRDLDTRASNSGSGVFTPLESRATRSEPPVREWDPVPEIIDKPLVTHDESRRSALFRRAHKTGTTSFSAVFAENQHSFTPDLLDVSNVDDRRVDFGISKFTTDFMEDNDVATRERMALGIKTLRSFPSRKACEMLLKSMGTNFNYESLMSEKTMWTCLSLLWEEFGSQLEYPRSCGSLSSMVLSLFENGQEPIKPAEGPDQWANWFGGPKLRWEMIGILFSFFGTAFTVSQEWDPVFDLQELHGANRKSATWLMKECADVCLQFCRETDTYNDLVVLLMIKTGTLESVCTGDESYQVSRRFDEVNSTVITVGLHRLPETIQPTQLSEFRKGLSTVANLLDKQHSSFNGRPPGLSRYYCTVQMPLDLRDDEICGSAENFNAAVSKLDSRGYNTSGAIYTRTILRALAFMSPIREETLELSLCVDVEEKGIRIERLLKRLEDSVAELPPQLRYEKDRPTATMDSFQLFTQLRLRVEYLQNRFLLERMKHKHYQNSCQELLGVALQLMETVLAFWLKKDHLVLFNYCFDWVITCYGVPAAGIIALELLEPVPESIISRSTLIQQLTLYIGFLEWIRPTDGNYQLCGKLRKVIRKILDTVLDPPKKCLEPVPSIEGNGKDISGTGLLPNANGNGNGNGIEMEGLGGENFWIANDEATCMDWLNTMDWTQGPWLDFNQPAY